MTARSGGAAVAGELDPTSTTWQSRWTLSTGKQYVVRATAVDADGRSITKMSRFRTLKPDTTADVQIFEGHNVTYGVGMPVMLTFSKPVENKKAVESALVLKSSRPVVGAWYWDGDQALWFRPRAYWPQNTKVSFIGHLDGVQLSPGVYATHTLRQDFRIGRSLIVVASASGHSMKVYKDRKLFATWPISTGRPGKDTPNGTYLSIEKANPQHMVGAGLRHPGAVLGALHLERRLHPRGAVVGRLAGLRQREPRLRERRPRTTPRRTTRCRSPATR